MKESRQMLTQEKIIIDGHADTLNFCLEDYQNFLSSAKTHVSLSMMEEIGVKAQVLAVCVHPLTKEANAIKKALEMITAYWKIIDHYYPRVFPVLTKGDLQKKEGIGLILALEGAEALSDKPDFIKLFFRLGVRMLSLTWNHTNAFAYGINSLQKGLLSDAGKDLIHLANELGILLDVSHLSEACFWELLSLSKMPVVASHSNAYEICNHPRNLYDKQLKAIAEKKGLVGINYYADFLGETPVAIENILKHMKYIRNLIGAEHVGLGSDFDGIERTPLDLKGLKDLPFLTSKIAENFSESDYHKIIGENWQRIFLEVLPDN